MATSWRTDPILWDLAERDNGGKNAGVHVAYADAGSSADCRSLTSSVKQLFRVAMQQLTRNPPAPEPKPPKRRKAEDTGHAFKLARKIFRRVLRVPVMALHAPELWQWNNPDSAYQLTEEFHYTEQNPLSPHL
jgi:hypothetical protein